MDSRSLDVASAQTSAVGHIGRREKQKTLGGSALIALLVFWAGYRDGFYDVSLWTQGAIVIWWVLLLGYAIGALPRRRATVPEKVIVAILAALVLLAGFSAFWAPSSEAALLSFDRGLMYLGALVFVVATTGAPGRVRWADALGAAIAGLAILALLSRLFPVLGLGKDLLAFLPDAQSRLSYPIGYWNGLAILVGLGFPILLRVAASSPSPWLSGTAMALLPSLTAVIYLASSRTGAVTVVLGAVVFVALAANRQRALGAAAIAIAGSVVAGVIIAQQHQLVDGPLHGGSIDRQGVVAAIVLVLTGVAAALLHIGLRRILRPFVITRRAGIAAAGVAAVAVITLGVAAHPIRHWNAFTTPPAAVVAGDYHANHFLSTNGNWRWQYWMSALDEFRAHPFVGGGAASFEPWWTQRETTAGFIGNAHSLFFETLAELGGIGGLLLVGLFGTGAVIAVRRCLSAAPELRDAAAATTGAYLAFCVALCVDWMWELPIVALVGLALMGLAIGIWHVEEHPPARPTTLGRVARIAIPIVAVVIVAAEADLFISTTQLSQSRHAVARGDLATAYADANNARRLEPWASSPYVQLALIEEQRGKLAAADKWIGKAMTKDTGDWRIPLIATRIEIYRGDIGAARINLNRARTLNPRFRAAAPS